jgi:hypothetical protein
LVGIFAIAEMLNEERTARVKMLFLIFITIKTPLKIIFHLNLNENCLQL